MVWVGGGIRDHVCVSEAKGKYVGKMLYIHGVGNWLVSGLLGAPYVSKNVSHICVGFHYFKVRELI